MSYVVKWREGYNWQQHLVKLNPEARTLYHRLSRGVQVSSVSVDYCGLLQGFLQGEPDIIDSRVRRICLSIEHIEYDYCDPIP